MSQGQTIFYQSLRAMRDLTRDGMLVDQAPSEVVHNKRANILRHGLVVCSFSSLETYLSDRFEDLCQMFANAGFSYSSSDVELQKFLLVDGVVGLAKSMNFQQKEDRLAYADLHLKRLATFDSQHPIYTSFGFPPRGSDVGESDISNAIRSFSINSPWSVLSSYTISIGGGTPNLKSDFESMGRERNKSAHNPSSQVATANVQQHIDNCIKVATSFDMAFVQIRRTLGTSGSFAIYKSKVNSTLARARFVDRRIDGKWDERGAPAGRSLKIHTDEASATTAAKQRTDVDIVIIRDEQRRPLAAKT